MKCPQVRAVVREEDGRAGQSLFVCWLVALRPSNRLVYLRDGSAQTILRELAREREKTDRLLYQMLRE